MDVISKIIDPQKLGKKVAKVAMERSGNALPIVKTIQAISSILEVGANVSNFVAKAGNAAEQTQKFIPEIQVMAQSLCDNVKTIGYFSASASAIGIGVNMVQTYQGIQALQLIAAKLEGITTQLAAQTALIAQREFPQYVYEMIGERLNQTMQDPVCDHWFFLYHPDNDWYPKFYHLLEKKPLGERFCGYTNQIDTIFIFMLAARNRIEKRNLRARERGRSFRHVKLHLLVPAYQPILVAEALKIPEEIGDFVIEGRVNSNKPFVWLNLPQDQRRYVMDVGHWDPPSRGWLSWAMSKLGMTQGAPVLGAPRVIGTRQLMLGEKNDDGGNSEDDCDASVADDGNDDDGEKVTTLAKLLDDVQAPETESNRRNATPVHHRHRRRRDKSQPKERKEAKESLASIDTSLISSHREWRSNR